MGSFRFSEKLVFYARYLSQKNLITGSEGNLSVRAKKGFFITPSGKIKDLLQPKHIIYAEIGKPYPSGVSSEVKMHEKIYMENQEAGAVVHTHPPYLLSLEKRLPDFQSSPDLSEFFEGKMIIKNISKVSFYLPGSQELAESVGKASKRAQVLFLEGHGLVVWGKDLEEAINLTLITEKLCYLKWLSL